MATLIGTFTKDPNATLDYAIDWSRWLGSDKITAASFSCPVGIALVSQEHNDTQATAWLSGGTLNAKYDIVCHVTTLSGRQDERTFRVQVKPL